MRWIQSDNKNMPEQWFNLEHVSQILIEPTVQENQTGQWTVSFNMNNRGMYIVKFCKDRQDAVNYVRGLVTA